jgi:hypothetical protein
MNAAAHLPPRHRLWRSFILGTLILLMNRPPARAGDLHGRMVITDLAAFSGTDSLDAALGEQNRNDIQGDLRIMWEHNWEHWKAAVDYQLSADAGGGVTLANREAGYFPNAPPATLFDLTGTLDESSAVRMTQKIDRLSLAYTTPNFVIRVGRQALTWGAGIMFHPMDLIDPFAPDTIDTEYKPGVDMAYTQWLLQDGSDLQVIVAPRAQRNGGPVAEDASTFAAVLHTRVGSLGTTWLLARDRGDWTMALGLSGSLGGAAWNAEIIPTIEKHGRVETSALVNISDAVTLFERNATLFAEYYHNGFGIAGDGISFDRLPSTLTSRPARGQVFNIEQDYLAGGMTLEWTPLLSLSPSIIINLNDGSAYTAGEANWSLNDNLNLIFGAQVPVGSKGTEYGGLPLADHAPSTVGPATLVYVQLRQHF